MSKGFQFKPDEHLLVESMVASRTFNPAVKISWGKKEAQMSLTQARHHAYAVLESAAAAELDACLVRWATAKLSLSPREAGQILMVFRQKRESGQLPSVTMNIDGEPVRPETAKQGAIALMDAAFGTEIEAFLVMFLMQDLGQSPEMADQLIQEFREMRGVTTAWPDEGERS